MTLTFEAKQKSERNRKWHKMKLNYTFVLNTALGFLLLLAGCSYVSEYIAHQAPIGSVCFTSGCIEEFSKIFSGAIAILTNGIAFIAICAAIFGSKIALDNYSVSVKSSALSGHINHLRLFQDYIETESSKFGIENTASVDTFFWYRTMFPGSKLGDVSVSRDYEKLVDGVGVEADFSSKSLSAPNVNEKYTFTNGDHQRRIISSLKKIGITLSRKPPKDFGEIENNTFLLIDSVNSTFSVVETGSSKVLSLQKNRSYQ
jgi:hypothetical protein